MTVPANYAAAMRQLESSGNYSALGPVVKRGSYAGDRAYGAYQVMGKNIPSWTRQALGRELTPQQFLADRAAQDQVFNYFFGRSLRQHGNPQDAASIWHSGSTLAAARRRNANDGYMATVDYVNKFTQFATGKGVSARAREGFSQPSGEADTSLLDSMTMTNAAQNPWAATQGAVPQMTAAQRKALQFRDDVQALGQLRQLGMQTGQRVKQVQVARKQGPRLLHAPKVQSGILGRM